MHARLRMPPPTRGAGTMKGEREIRFHRDRHGPMGVREHPKRSRRPTPSHYLNTALQIQSVGGADARTLSRRKRHEKDQRNRHQLEKRIDLGRNGGSGPIRMTRGGPRGHARTKTWRGGPAKANYPSYSADDNNGKGAIMYPHFTHQLVFVGALTHSVGHSRSRRPGGWQGGRHGQPNSRQAPPR